MAQAKAAAPQNGNIRALLFLGLAVLAGLAAVVLIYQVIQSYKEAIDQASQPDQTVNAIVAAGDLYPGVTISEEDLVMVPIPVQYVPKDEAGNLLAFTSAEAVVGRIPRERILGNEFILPDRLADPKSGLGLNVLIEEGMRAISLNVQNGAAVSGFLQPGNLVDLIVTITPEDDNAEPETLPLLQAVPILAVNNRLRDDDENTAKDPGAPPKPKKKPVTAQPSVTLMVTPDQAELAAHAARVGRITMALRSNNDYNNVATGTIETKDFFTADHPVDTPKPKVNKPKPKINQEPEGVTIQVIRAGVKTNVKQPPQ
jgi:pilus assembly protein CpaB